MTEQELGDTGTEAIAGHATPATSLRIEGNQRLEAQAIIQLGNIDVANLRSSDADAIAEALTRTGLFKTVHVELGEDGLSVLVCEQPVVNRVVVQGAPNAAQVTEILARYGIAPRQIYSPIALASGQLAIESALIKSDHTLRSPIQVIELDAQRIDIVVNIDRLEVDNVAVSGLVWRKSKSNSGSFEYISPVIDPSTNSPDLPDAGDPLRDAVCKALTEIGLSADLQQTALQSIRQSLAEKGVDLVATQRLPQAGVASPTTQLPTEAPETYQGLRGPETPPEFVKRVYGPWLGQGLTRADIRKLDPKLSVAITNWLSRPGNAWPEDVDLPTKAEQNERLLSAGPEAIREHLGKFTGQEALREAARINAAAHYRK
ncbi:hypothetical protein [Sphingomonas sp. 35-24ZXX]|uniref:hypothetical protein n=1 Tax=Sphingomonas sp. 35-24ZXX TaxID=1545915 RepID=UPI00053BEAC1|nr:hypothetical protein [Sphingomonas sp. 35-24ZXX]